MSAIINGGLDVLNCAAGHLKFNFSKDRPDEVEKAKKVIADMLKRGYFIFVLDNGEQKRVRQFDPDKEEYILEEPDEIPEPTPILQSPELKLQSDRVTLLKQHRAIDAIEGEMRRIRSREILASVLPASVDLILRPIFSYRCDFCAALYGGPASICTAIIGGRQCGGMITPIPTPESPSVQEAQKPL